MTTLSSDPIQRTIYGDLKRGIQLALEHKCFNSALIVLLTTIDVMGNLDRPEGQDENQPSDFIRWADVYLTSRLPYNITAEELYSARCAVLHTLGVESRKTKAGEARRISFAYGGVPDSAYDSRIDRSYMVLGIEILASALFSAIDEYLMKAFASEEKGKLVERRLRKILTTIPYAEAVKDAGSSSSATE